MENVKQIATWIVEHKLLIFEGIIALVLMLASISGWRNIKSDERLLIGLVLAFAVSAVVFNSEPILHRTFVFAYIIFGVMYAEKDLIAEWANRRATEISLVLGVLLLGFCLYGQSIRIGRAELLILTLGTLSLIGLGMFGLWKKITSSNISKIPPAKAL